MLVYLCHDPEWLRCQLNDCSHCEQHNTIAITFDLRLLQVWTEPDHTQQQRRDHTYWNSEREGGGRRGRGRDNRYIAVMVGGSSHPYVHHIKLKTCLHFFSSVVSERQALRSASLERNNTEL